MERDRKNSDLITRGAKKPVVDHPPPRNNNVTIKKLENIKPEFKPTKKLDEKKNQLKKSLLKKKPVTPVLNWDDEDYDSWKTFLDQPRFRKPTKIEQYSNREHLQSLIQMGFKEELAKKALESTNNDVNQAATLLLSDAESQKSTSIETKIISPTPSTDNIISNDIKLANIMECVICFESTRNAIFLPCYHICSCWECASSVHQKSGVCPICRVDIQSAQKVFFV